MTQIVVWEFWCSSCWTTVQTANDVEGDILHCPVCDEDAYRGRIAEVR